MTNDKLEIRYVIDFVTERYKAVVLKGKRVVKIGREGILKTSVEEYLMIEEYAQDSYSGYAEVMDINNILNTLIQTSDCVLDEPQNEQVLKEIFQKG